MRAVHLFLLILMLAPAGASGSVPGSRVVPAAVATQTAADREALRRSLVPYAQFVADVGDRPRRVIYTPYPVSAEHGVVEAFVHVGSGTAVPSRTDLVVDAPLPIVVRRAYHSARAESDDFGTSGWRLTLAETIERVPGAGFVYRYGNGAALKLRSNGAIHSPLQAALTDVAAVRVLSRARLEVRTRTGLTKMFQAAQGRFRLASVTDAYGNALELHYADGGALSRVESSAGVWVAFARDTSGRVSRVSDAHGRSVGYEYDSHGALANVTDVAGQNWGYAYDRGRLTATRTPNGLEDLAFAYDAAGRVTASAANGLRRVFAYDGDRTEVALPAEQADDGSRIRFWSAPSGLTAVVETALTRTALQLDAHGVPVGLLRNEELLAQLSTVPSGHPVGTRATVRAASGGHYRLRFDAAGRLMAASSDSDGSLYQVLQYGPGLLPLRLRHADGGVESVAFDSRGELVALTRGRDRALAFERIGAFWRIRGQEGRTAELMFDPLGRLAAVTTAQGLRMTFGYNEAGLREAVDTSDGVRVRYHYDASGNLFHSQVSTAAGSAPAYSYLMDPAQRVEAVVSSAGSRTVFEYDAAGTLRSVSAPGGAQIQFGYDRHHRLRQVSPPSGNPIAYAYAAGEPDLVAQLGRRKLPVYNQQREINDFGSRFDTVLTRIRPSGLGAFTYEESVGELAFAFDPAGWNPLSALNRSVDALRIQALIDGEPGAVSEFTMPANRLFVPAEYWSVNCCICLCQDPAYTCNEP